MTSRPRSITLLHVDDFGLSVRAFNVLADLEVETVSDLVRLSPEELLRHQRNCGRKTLAEIEAFAHFLGVRLGGEEGSATAVHFELSGARVAASDGGFPLAWLLAVDEIPLSWRATRCLEELGARFLGDVASLRPAGILEPSQHSHKTLREIIDMVGRFGAFMGIDAPAWRHADPCALATKYESELRLIRAELVAERFGTDLMSSSLVEDEVRVALSKLADRRRLEMIVAWIGLDKDRDPKVADVADKAFVSRERVYQIRVALAKKLRRYCVPTSTLDRAVQSIEAALPASGELIEARLRGAGLIRERTRLRGVVRSARFFGTELDAEARRFGGRDFWVRSGDTILEDTLSETKKAVKGLGFAQVQDAAASIAEVTGRYVSTKLISDLVSELDVFSWLDQEGGWFWLPDKPQNPLRRRIDKILAVCGRIELALLRAGIARGRGKELAEVPVRVLRAFCEQLPDCVVEAGSNEVVDKGARSTQRFLSSTELRLFHTLKEFGPVMGRAELVMRAIRSGYKRSTVEALIANSPVLRRFEGGGYGLISKPP